MSNVPPITELSYSCYCLIVGFTSGLVDAVDCVIYGFLILFRKKLFPPHCCYAFFSSFFSMVTTLVLFLLPEFLDTRFSQQKSVRLFLSCSSNVKLPMINLLPLLLLNYGKC